MATSESLASSKRFRTCSILQPANRNLLIGFMEYFIDDMLGPSRRSSAKSAPTHPAPAEPPLPPFPTPTRIKKAKTVKFPADSTGAVAESSRNSKASDTSTAAKVPLPDTPGLPSVREQAGASAPQPPLLSSVSLPSSGNRAEGDYFSAAELALPENASESLRVREPATPGAPAFFTPMSELPMVPPEMPQLAEAPAAEREQAVETASSAEQRGSVADTGEQSAAAKEMPENPVEAPPPVLHVLPAPTPVAHDYPALMIGLSGAPASGKTTLAYLLAAILPPNTSSFIIHQDDFFIRKHLLIPSTDGESIVEYRRTLDFPAFKKLIEHSKREGKLPAGYRSLQPEEEQGRALSQLPSGTVERMQASLADLTGLKDGQAVGIVDGSLLYHSGTIRNLLDIKILLRASKKSSRIRQYEKSPENSQNNRKGGNPWETIEYFDHVLWPNYADEHAILFEDRNVEGQPVADTCERVGISVQPNLDMNIEEIMHWVVDVIRRGCEEAAHRRGGEVASADESVEGYEFCECNEGLLGRIRQTIFDIL